VGLAKGLNDLQKRAADLYLDGWPITRIANYLEVSRVSLWAWKKLPEWQDYIREQTGEVLEARNHRVRRVVDLALETIESALLDTEIAPLKRAELAIRWLSMIRESMAPVDGAPAPSGQKTQLPSEVLNRIRVEVYGLQDPEVEQKDP
jgi:hypothetical protein